MYLNKFQFANTLVKKKIKYEVNVAGTVFQQFIKSKIYGEVKASQRDTKRQKKKTISKHIIEILRSSTTNPTKNL